MSRSRYVSAIAIVFMMLLSTIVLFTSQNAQALQKTWTTDVDFNDGKFFFSEVKDTGVDAYVQNRKDQTNWIQKYPATNTGPRRGFGFANSSSEGRYIFFGGVDDNSFARNDTWEYDYPSNNWERICNDDTAACAPPRRYSPSMAYDNNSKVAVLYGGFAEDFITVLSDTWEYHINNNTWVNRTPVIRPRSLQSHAMVYDAVSKQMVLIGATLSNTMEIWTYNAATHTWTQKPYSGGPSIRMGFTLGYSYQQNYKRVILFGGGYIMDVYDETWEYNPLTNSWYNTGATGPAASTEGAMTYVFKASMEGVILWGGSSWATETWRYFRDPDNGNAPTWLMLTTMTAPSPARKQHGIAYDPGYDAVIMYGGATGSGQRLNDTWFLEGGYRLQGSWYMDKYFSTGDQETEWQYLFWNQSGGNLPPNTQIRLKLNVSNKCNEPEPIVWYGPNKNPGVYFLTSPATLGPSYRGWACVRILVEMLTWDPAIAPKLEDVSLEYIPGPGGPKVTSYSPSLAGNPLNAPVRINFTKPMDTSNVFISIIPNVTFQTPWQWYQGDTKVTIWHNSSLFLEGKRYDVCVWGTDKFGNLLNHTNNRFCWLFTTRAFAPYVQSTSPSHTQVNVAITANVIITFNEPMDPTTCWPHVTITGPSGPHPMDGHTWNPTNTVLTMTHTMPFAQLTDYTADVPIGDLGRPCKDASGQLLTIGPIPNPWQFQTAALNPYIVSTDPMDLQTRVPITQKITVTFSRFMSMPSLTYAFKDLSTTPVQNWTGTFTLNWPNNRTVEFLHSTSFTNCKPYQMELWGLDFTGKSLITNPAAPNPWRFMTIGTGANGCPPSMLFTDPYHGQREQPVWKNITIGWAYDPDPPAGGMSSSSFVFEVRDPNDLVVTSNYIPMWGGMSNDYVVLEHPGYQMLCGMYTVRVITARDMLGRNFIPGMAENPFNFWVNATTCPPVVVWTKPAHNEMNAPLMDAIEIKFNKPMDTSFYVFNLRPDTPPYTYTWSPDETLLTITHGGLIACEFYNASIVGRDKDGNFLANGPAPNPWMFRGDCQLGPRVRDTNPMNGQTGVEYGAPIWVNFTEEVVPTSLQFTLNPTAGSLTYDWYNNNQTVKISHSQLFTECELYTARVVDVVNMSGWHLVGGGAPNPWTFRAKCVRPQITMTTPPDNAIDVGLGDSITVVFSEVMQKSSFSIIANPGMSFNPPTWPNDQTAVITHSSPFQYCTKYMITVSARDLDGNNLEPGPVPNPWNFTTDCRFPLQGLQVHRVPPDDIRLTWTAATGVSYYWVYHSTNKFAPWPWTVAANVTTNSALLSNHLSDMQDHYYIVKGFKPGAESSNSTMGVLRHLTIRPLVGRTGNYWFSLPYNTMYKRASDIASELTPTKINIVAKWNPATQQSILYYYINGVWRGTNFPIAPGDGLWIGVIGQIDWAINGTDKTVSSLFTYRMYLESNYYWVGLPYTGKIGAASQLVLSIAGGLGPGTNTKIDAVGKWNYEGQANWVFQYSMSGWSGTDFLVFPGDGIWIRITSTFSWTPELITPEVP